MIETDHPVALDTLDRRILPVLQRRGDISHADLAEAVAASPASCWRRIKALAAAGVLLPAVRLLDPVRIGRGLDVISDARVARTSDHRDIGIAVRVEARQVHDGDAGLTMRDRRQECSPVRRDHAATIPPSLACDVIAKHRRDRRAASTPQLL